MPLGVPVSYGWKCVPTKYFSKLKNWVWFTWNVATDNVPCNRVHTILKWFLHYDEDFSDSPYSANLNPQSQPQWATVGRGSPSAILGRQNLTQQSASLVVIIIWPFSAYGLFCCLVYPSTLILQLDKGLHNKYSSLWMSLILKNLFVGYFIHHELIST